MTMLFTLIGGLIAGGIAGFCTHVLIMKINFKQRAIENKIKVYDAIIVHWVKTRNFIYSQLPKDPRDNPQFDIMYGDAQSFIGEAILVSEDTELTDSINTLNEKLYRTNWEEIPDEKADAIMENIKKEAIPLVLRMREDIKDSTRFELKDFLFIRVFRKKQAAKHSRNYGEEI